MLLTILFIPLIIGAAIALFAGGAIVASFSKVKKPSKDLNLAILGMKNSGKTQLWNVITNGQLKQSPTAGSETIKKCTVEINGIKRTLKQSLDVEGSRDLVKLEYKNLIDSKDFILFIFDSNLLLNRTDLSKEYIEDLKMRLKMIKRNIDGKSNTKSKLTNLHIIGSHADLLCKDIDSREKYKHEIINKLGKSFFNTIGCDPDNIVLLNLTNNDETKGYIAQVLFNKE